MPDNTPKVPSFSNIMRPPRGRELPGFNPDELAARVRATTAGSTGLPAQGTLPAPRTDVMPDATERVQAQLAADPRTPADKAWQAQTQQQRDDAAAKVEASTATAQKMAGAK